jgi:hypothetical protein
MTNSMTCTEFEALLTELLDDESAMTPAARAHLGRCAACQSLLSDLTAIRAQAGALPALQPERDLWAGIEARIEAPVVPLAVTGGRLRGQLSWRMAGLAAAALVVLTSAITYQITRPHGPNPTDVATARPRANTRDSSPTTVVVSTDAGSTGARPSSATSPAPSRIVMTTGSPVGATVAYDREVARLRAILDSGRTRLDPATVALLERNLTVIDSAIVQCQRALLKDPASAFLIESRNNSYQTKVKLLRIAAAASKG